MFCFFKTVVGISAFQAVEKVTYRLLFDVDVSQSDNWSQKSPQLQNTKRHFLLVVQFCAKYPTDTDWG